MAGFRNIATGFAALLAAAVLPASGGIIILPTFDSTIATDANSGAIEGVINSAISLYEATILNAITVNIIFKEGSGLGGSSFTDYNVRYSDYYSALQFQNKSADDVTALARLAADGSVVNPVNGTTNIEIKSTLGRALGFGGFGTGPDGTISLNTAITSPGSTGSSGAYNLLTVVEHEIDEILGLGSTLGAVNSTEPSPEDFFRFDGSNARTFTTGAATAYFSLNGTTNLAQFNNPSQSGCTAPCGGGDYGDWASVGAAKVQDAYATAGANPALGVELQALDVIGYDIVATPEPGTLFLVGSALIGVGAWKKFRNPKV